MNIFLRAKHWQLFLLTFGIPFIAEMVMMSTLFLSIGQHNDPFGMLGDLKFFPVMMLLFMGTLLGWQWAVATGLQKMLPPGLTMKVTKFKVFFIIPVIYLLLIMTGVWYLFSSGLMNGDDPTAIFSFIPLILPLHLFSMFCLFYSIYFVAKTFKTVELQRPVTFSDFAGEFFLVWFYPIGVWIIQPKINQMIKQYEEQKTLII